MSAAENRVGTAAVPARPQISPLPEFPVEAIPGLLAMAERAIEEVNKGDVPPAQPASKV